MNDGDVAEFLQVPKYFGEDLFSLLTEERRPNYRWLIMVRLNLNRLRLTIHMPASHSYFKMAV